MREAIATLLTLLLVPQLGVPQSLSWKDTLAVKDTSEPGNPLRATGSAVLSNMITSEGLESHTELVAVLTNVLSKPVMAYEAIVDLSPKYGGGERVISRVDYWFSGEPLAPNSTSLIRVSPHRGLEHGNHDAHPKSLGEIDSPTGARAHVKVTFVQFADGTTFGVCDWGNGLQARREKLTTIIRGLLRAFDRDKERGLSVAIGDAQGKLDLPDEIHSSLTDIQGKFHDSGTNATVQYLKDYLANAQRNSLRSVATP